MNLCTYDENGAVPIEGYLPMSVADFEVESGIIFDVTGSCRTAYGEATLYLLPTESYMDNRHSVDAKLGKKGNHNAQGRSTIGPDASCAVRSAWAAHHPTVIRHELGHMFGLEHAPDDDNIMCTYCGPVEAERHFSDSQINSMQKNADLFGLCKI